MTTAKAIRDAAKSYERSDIREERFYLRPSVKLINRDSGKVVNAIAVDTNSNTVRTKEMGYSWYPTRDFEILKETKVV